MKLLTGAAIVLLALAVGCKERPQDWLSISGNPTNWFYLIARDVRLREPFAGAEIHDESLIFTDPQIASFDDPDRLSNLKIIVAMPKSFQSMLVTGAVGRATIPELRGKVLPTVVDRKIEVHFLSHTNGKWFSTNLVRTRIISVTCSP